MLRAWEGIWVAMARAVARRCSDAQRLAVRPCLIGGGYPVDEGLVLLASWLELGSLVALLAFFVLRGRGHR
jgi:hypothetical protein